MLKRMRPGMSTVLNPAPAGAIPFALSGLTRDRWRHRKATMKPRTLALILATCTLAVAGGWWAAGLEARALTDGRMLLLDGKNAEALVLAQKIASDHDRSATAFAFLAQAELANGHLEAAELAVKKAGVLATGDQQAVLQEVRRQLTAAKQAHAEAAAALEKRCEELLTEVQNDRIDPVFEEIARLAVGNPRHLGCQRLLGQTHWKRHNLKLAAEAFEKAILLAEGETRTKIVDQLKDLTAIISYLDRMHDLVDKDDFDAVLTEAGKAEDEQVYDYEIYLMAGSAQLSQGKLPEAKATFTKARAIAPLSGFQAADDFLKRTETAIVAKARAELDAANQKKFRIALADEDPTQAAQVLASEYRRPDFGIANKPFPPALFIQAAQKCIMAAENGESPDPLLYLPAGAILKMGMATYPDGAEGEQLAVLASSISNKVLLAVLKHQSELKLRNDAFREWLVLGKPTTDSRRSALFYPKFIDVCTKWNEPSHSQDIYVQLVERECLRHTEEQRGAQVGLHIKVALSPNLNPPHFDEAAAKKAVKEMLTGGNNAYVFAWMASHPSVTAATKEHLGCVASSGKGTCLLCKGSGLGAPRRKDCDAGCDKGKFYGREDRVTQAFVGANTEYSSISSRYKWEREMDELRVSKAGVWKEVDRQGNYVRGITNDIRLDDTVRYVRFVSRTCEDCKGRGYFEYSTDCTKCKGAKTQPILVLTPQ